jgi:hypothetical protein
MSRKQPEQTSTLREVGEQGEVITFDPAVKGSVTYSFESKEQSKCHHLTWVEAGLRVFGYILHQIIYSAKQLCDKILGRHEVLLVPAVW